MVGPGAHRQLGVTVQVHAQRPQAACTSGRQSARGAQRELHTLPEGRPAAPSAWPSLTRHWVRGACLADAHAGLQQTPPPGPHPGARLPLGPKGQTSVRSGSRPCPLQTQAQSVLCAWATHGAVSWGCLSTPSRAPLCQRVVTLSSGRHGPAGVALSSDSKRP